MKVSILSVFYNDEAMLKITMKSVLSQSYENIEHIIIDGGSKDNSVALIKKCEPKYNGRLKWVSEPDKGIYDAINKALKLATGDIIVFSTDEYANNSVVENVVCTLQEEKSDGCFGGLIFVNGERVIRHWKSKRGNLLYGWMPAHPTLFLRKEVYEKFGNYKTTYKCAADYEFMLRILKDGTTNLTGVDCLIVKLHYGGTSTGGLKAMILGIKEGHRALVENGYKNAWFTDFCRIIRTLYSYIKH